jgi:hypothetical protein
MDSEPQLHEQSSDSSSSLTTAPSLDIQKSFSVSYHQGEEIFSELEPSSYFSTIVELPGRSAVDNTVFTEVCYTERDRTTSYRSQPNNAATTIVSSAMDV